METQPPQKLYAFVDESGQDTLGALFVVAAVLTGDDHARVRQTCHDFAIPYVCYPTIRAALGGHYRWLQTLGQGGGPRSTPSAGLPQGGKGPDGAPRAGVSTARPASD